MFSAGLPLIRPDALVTQHRRISITLYSFTHESLWSALCRTMPRYPPYVAFINLYTASYEGPLYSFAVFAHVVPYEMHYADLVLTRAIVGDHLSS